MVTLGYGIGNRNKTLYDYKRKAKERGYSWELTDEQAISLFESTCFYCGIPPSISSVNRKNSTPYIRNGIDRKNNSIGYTPENCVACCKECNHWKGNRNFEDFMNHITRIANHLSKPQI